MKRTIYLNPTTAALLDVANEPNLSARVAMLAASQAGACDAAQIPRDEADALPSMLQRYRAILDDATPTLTENEWALLCDVLKGSALITYHADPARRLALSVIDSGTATGDKWGVDLASLSVRLDRLPYAAQCAVAETVARFWRQAGSSLAPIGQHLRAAGAKVASGEDLSA